MRVSTLTSPPSLLEWLAMTDEERELARAAGFLPPIAGASSGSAPGGGEGEGGGAGSGEPGSGGGEGSGSGSSSDENEDEDHEDSDSEDDEDEHDDDERTSGRSGRRDRGGPEDLMELKRSEYERLRRIAREQETAEKKREREERKAQEKRRREQGQFDELLSEKDEQIRTVEGERDEARYQLDAFKRQVRVTEAAKRLGFKDPEDAFRYLSDEDTEDEATTERALKALSKRKSYLVNERKSTGAPVGGANGVTLTLEQIQRMSPDEINARWDEVQKVMATQP